MKFCVQKQRGRVSSSHCPEALPPQDEIDLCFFVVCYFLCVRVLLSGAFYYVPDLVCRVLFGVAFGAVTSVLLEELNPGCFFCSLCESVPAIR